jgi:hypothetical protein
MCSLLPLQMGIDRGSDELVSPGEAFGPGEKLHLRSLVSGATKFDKPAAQIFTLAQRRLYPDIFKLRVKVFARRSRMETELQRVFRE